MANPSMPLHPSCSPHPSSSPKMTSGNSNHQVSQADFRARLVKLTTELSTRPLPPELIIDLQDKIESVEYVLSLASSDHFPAQHAATALPCQHLPTRGSTVGEIPLVVMQSISASASKTTTAPSRSSGLSHATTRPTTRGTVSGEEDLSQGTDPRLRHYQALSTNAEVAHGVGGVGREVLESITSLVTEMRLRQEEARHIHELALQKIQIVSQELVQLRKEYDRLQVTNQASAARIKNLESTVHRLIAARRDFDRRLDRLMADCTSDEMKAEFTGPNAGRKPQDDVEKWRLECANFRSKNDPT